jgi:hypothetical protein
MYRVIAWIWFGWTAEDLVTYPSSIIILYEWKYGGFCVSLVLFFLSNNVSIAFLIVEQMTLPGSGNI